jgi:fidgetin-like protein 1
MGDAEKMVRKLFQVARELAPSILFLDEMDALLSSRKSDGGEHEASRRLKTEFMVQMDGITKSDESNIGRHLLLIACTNCPWDVDSAVLRRFPRRIYVPLPDSDARRALIEYLLRKAGKHSVTTRQISTLVKRTEGFTCSDITAIASEASFGPLRSLGGIEAIKDCSAADVRPVQLQDFESVINETTKSVTEAQLQRYEQWQKQQAAS